MYLQVSVILLTGGGACSGGCMVLGRHGHGGCMVLGGVNGPGGMHGPGGRVLGGLVETTSPDGYCCGRYASYWNAFLLVFLMKGNGDVLKDFHSTPLVINFENIGEASNFHHSLK